ncbi:MAG: hypothetical protein ACHRHE_06515 [Tepidisphaerales bacterium]
MVLRKCPSCKELVGADSLECPRCGVSFKAAMFRRLLKWTAIAAVAAWVTGHYILKLI